MSPNKGDLNLPRSGNEGLELAEPFKVTKEGISAVKSVEKNATREKAPDISEQPENILDAFELPGESKQSEEEKQTAQAPAAPNKGLGLEKIEKILQEDLEDVYFKMEQEEQNKFKVEGEKVATKIEKLLAEPKIKSNKIFKLIFKWLKMIPGVNRFFIKQEAKIKTDKIIKLS